VNLRILVVDNYDSFVYNLVQYLGQLGVETEVHRNDEVDIDRALSDAYAGVLISPGPGTPERAGVSVPLVQAAHARAVAGNPAPSVFGVCLGLQAIGVAYGARVGRAPELLHGKTSLVEHTGEGVLEGLPSPFTATRYHSLAIDPATVTPELEVTARTRSGVIMAARARDAAIEGVQFHPESVLTEGGHRMLANWLTRCGDADAVARSAGLAPVVAQR